jgi:hypothetical protein
MTLAELRLQRGSDHRRSKELENRVREEAATRNEGTENRLQERNRDIREREGTLHCCRCEELCMVHTELCLQRENANQRIRELENMVREQTSTGRRWGLLLMAVFRT